MGSKIVLGLIAYFLTKTDQALQVIISQQGTNNDFGPVC
jgi:hypothetical protein